MPPRTAEYPRPNHTLLHLSDTRLLTGAGGFLFDRVDTETRLRTIVDRFASSGHSPQAIIFTGDLCEFGEVTAYSTMRRIVEPLAEQLGSAIIWVPGERDSRTGFRRELLGQLPSEDPIDRVTFVDGLRVITLDTTVPGRLYGEVESDQLDWLADELLTPAPYGTILAMHHPPVPTMVDLDAATELRSQSALRRVIVNSDVRCILAGHVHYSAAATFAGIPVSIASATSFTRDLTAPAGAQRALDGGQSYNLVTVYDDTIMHTVVPVSNAPILSWVSADEAQALLAVEDVVIADSPVARARAAERSERHQPVWELTAG